jgi:hypothetical protein
MFMENLEDFGDGAWLGGQGNRALFDTSRSRGVVIVPPVLLAALSKTGRKEELT